MAKCFLTGIEVPLGEAYLLDIAAANRVIRELREQLKVLERLVEQFSPDDLVEAYDHALHRQVSVKRKRLVCKPVVETFRSAANGQRLFILWPEWRARKRSKTTPWLSHPSLEKPTVNLALEDGNHVSNNGGNDNGPG